MVINPKGTAAWLIENTSLTFEQIADFCHLHYMEIEAIANDEVLVQPVNPIENHQLTRDEITRCESNENTILTMTTFMKDLTKSTKKKKYKPIAKRNLIPCAILYLIIKYPELLDKHIIKLVGTTQSTVTKIRDRSYKGIASITPKDPVLAGFCTNADIQEYLNELQ
ncbi:cell cycle transcriptional regulator TrcR [Candidatus Deianiraea vastatrix]|uniref:Cytoplasmic protein n=1 Tax=Candidatus Deianiraea vastatrix TaxID=2163644 RepID=A0A5B8XJL1_9RICK|nr:cell cycle transcriptional regulator TrcR [Candidatus Deianiraea vastatrix]QED23737.1 Putative cytoplasmic protein [Candidatus Deianiraea vastatrix]